MIKLTDLLTEAESFTAINKDTGKVSVFKSKDSRDAAIKAGTHDEKEEAEKGGDSAGEKEKPNMFSKDTGYDAPDVDDDDDDDDDDYYDDEEEDDIELPKDFQSDVESSLKGIGFSSAYLGGLDGVEDFEDSDGNYVSISKGKVFDDDNQFAVMGGKIDDREDADADTNYQSFDTKEDAVAYAKELAQKLKGGEAKEEPKEDTPKSVGLLPSQSEEGSFQWTTGKLKPKKADKKLVSLVNKLSKKAKLEPNKISREEYEKRMLSVVHDALEDANFHGANRQIFADLQGKPELAKRADYSKAPEMGTPEREEWDMNNSIYNKTFDGITSEFDGSNDFATTISSESGWDGEQTIAALLAKMRKDGHGNLADKIQTSFEKSMANNEAKLKLGDLI
jgi:hypothetical protein